jgi:uncharacterized membrane protein YphA (DoxX/SURF4 family)
MKLLINIARIAIGVLFLFSGLVKANDPLGLSYKMQEFFEVWNVHWLDNFTLGFSILMIVFEIVAGVSILLGWRMRLFSWLLLLLILFFTFLTGYAYLSGKVKECGCFGNCIPLTAGQSFAKDLILTGLIFFVFVHQAKIKPVLTAGASLAVLAISGIFSFSLQWYVLAHLPLVDCLPYKVGVRIEEAMKIPPGAQADSLAISFVYLHNGKQLEFTADQFPKDFDDSYKFVKRYDKLVRKGNAEPAIKDFDLLTSSGQDSTQEILQTKGYCAFLFAQDMADDRPAWNKAFSVIYALLRQKHIPQYLITANDQQASAFVRLNDIADGLPVLKCDATAIKTAARANPTLYLLKHGVILEKWSYADFESAIQAINALPEQPLVLSWTGSDALAK